MSVSRDIVATYRGPGRVVRRLLDMGPREDRALAMLMGACAITFVSQWPVLSRRAHLSGEELNPLLGASLMAWIFIAPLMFYVIALLVALVLRMLGYGDAGYAARLTLFWAFLAASPLLLLFGLTIGFMGQGAASGAVGLVWVLCFVWFWIGGLRQVDK